MLGGARLHSILLISPIYLASYSLEMKEEMQTSEDGMDAVHTSAIIREDVSNATRNLLNEKQSGIQRSKVQSFDD